VGPLHGFFGEFKELGFTTEKFILGLLVKGIVFGLFMSLLFGKTVFKKENKENED